MVKKILVGAIAMSACVGVAFAATKLGVVQGNAYAFSDEGARTCCPQIRYPSGAATELRKACEGIGGTFWKNERFVDSAYCQTRPITGAGWKYKCSKLVEADCYK